MSSAPRPVRSAGAVRPHGHLRRALGLENNPLSRPLDRARSRVLLLAAFGVGPAALLSTAVGLTDFDSSHRQAVVTAAHLHRAEAVVLRPIRRTADAALGKDYQADAAWTYPSGHRNTGTIDLSWRADPGAVTGIWVGDTGRLASAPPSSADLIADAVCLGMFTLGGLCVLIASGLGARLNSLDRKAARQWQESWTQLEPVWTGRTSPGNNHS